MGSNLNITLATNGYVLHINSGKGFWTEVYYVREDLVDRIAKLLSYMEYGEVITPKGTIQAVDKRGPDVDE